MSAYLINNYLEITDEAKVARYAELAGPVVRANGGRFLVRGNPGYVFEDGVELRTVLIEFPDIETAIASYRSDGYQQALEALGDGARRDVRIVDGVREPGPGTQPI